MNRFGPMNLTEKLYTASKKNGGSTYCFLLEEAKLCHSNCQTLNQLRSLPPFSIKTFPVSFEILNVLHY